MSLLGTVFQKIPKKHMKLDWLAGQMIANSALQFNPSLDYLCPMILQWLTWFEQQM